MAGRSLSLFAIMGQQRNEEGFVGQVPRGTQGRPDPHVL